MPCAAGATMTAAMDSDDPIDGERPRGRATSPTDADADDDEWDWAPLDVIADDGPPPEDPESSVRQRERFVRRTGRLARGRRRACCSPS